MSMRFTILPRTEHIASTKNVPRQVESLENNACEINRVPLVYMITQKRHYVVDSIPVEDHSNGNRVRLERGMCMIEIDFDKGNGLLPAIVQEYETKEVLMLAYMNRTSWLKTLETGKATFWSRSRNVLWVKGESSGHVQNVREIRIDCDSDTILLLVDQIGGAACHTGHKSCFHRRLSGGELETIGEKVFVPEDVYKK